MSESRLRPADRSRARAPRPDARLEVAQRERRERKIGADQHGRRQHGQRIVHEMAPGRPDLVGQRVAENVGLDGRAVRMQGAFDQTRIGLGVLAERDRHARRSLPWRGV